MKFLDNDGDNLDHTEDGYMVLSVTGEWVPLKTKLRLRLSINSSRRWDAIRAISKEEGYEVLIAGCRRKRGYFAVASFDSNGILSTVTNWRSSEQSIDAGWDSKFDFAFNPETSSDLIPLSLEIGVRTMGIYDYKDDLDRYELNLKAGQNYAIKAEGLGLAYPHVSIRDSNYNIVDYNITFYDRDKGVVFTPERSGLFYLDVSSTEAISGAGSRGIYSDANNDDSATYIVSVDEIADDYTDDFDAGEQVNVGDEVIGSIDFPGDEDWFSIDLEKGTIYEIVFESNIDWSSVDFIVRNSVESIWTGDVRSNSSLVERSFRVPESGTYYVGNIHYGSRYSDNFEWESLDYEFSIERLAQLA